jgi:Pyruvate/2-oxoacid:ferredoxin oxidoreductase gamma subunit
MTRPDATQLLDTIAGEPSLALGAADELLLKALCEIDVNVTQLTLPSMGLGLHLLDVARRPDFVELLAVHELTVVPTFDGMRALELTRAHVDMGRAAVAVIPNELLGTTATSWPAMIGVPLDVRGSAMTVIAVDDPHVCPGIDPRALAATLDFPTIEAADVDDLRRALEESLRISRSVRRPTVLIVHESIFRTFDTVALRSNRMSLTGIPEGPRRRPRVSRTESDDVKRLARRIELNTATAIPNPGERVRTGFVVVGPAAPSLNHLVQILQLVGRVPIVHMRVINPMDDVLLGRLLLRCEDVIVLEPRPGSVESQLLLIAERMRRRNERPATIWGRVLPPADEENEPYVVSGDELLHPSVLARRITHLLHAIRPSVQIQRKLHDVTLTPPRPPRMRTAKTLRTKVQRLVDEAEAWINEPEVREERELEPTTVAVDGRIPLDATGRIVLSETWMHDRFLRRGVAAVRQLSSRREPAILIVLVTDAAERQNLERFARGIIPGEFVARSTIISVSLAVRNEVRDALRTAVASGGLTIMLVAGGMDDPATVSESMREVDALGFEARQRFTVPADFACHPAWTPIEQVAVDRRSIDDPIPAGISVDKLGDRVGPRVRLRIRALVEHVDVFREHPPASNLRRRGERLVVPSPVHGHLAVWRAHVAGVRGDGPGVAAALLARAGRVMGYLVRGWYDPTPVRRGVHAWTQLMFTQPRTERHAILPAITLPFGEANLLLGHDPASTRDALSPDGALHIAAHDMTCAAIDVPERDDERHDADRRERLMPLIEKTIAPEHLAVADASKVCRTWFHTDRVLDVVLLGAAYQRGWIPVTIDAMETAIAQMESLGFGEIASAFHLGRRLVALPDSVTRSTGSRDEPVTRFARRLALGLQLVSWGGDQTVGDFRRLVDRGLTGMPGLAETDAGRAAQRQFVLALYGAVMWGGVRYAEQYADRLIRLYHADRGDRGRTLTRYAVRPLADAVLIADPIFVTTMMTSPAYRGRLRRELNIRRSRGDRLVRHIVTRLELVAFGHRFRSHARITESIARVIARMRRIVPMRWRGTRRDREQRRILEEFIDRTVHLSASRYEELATAMKALHDLAVEGRIRRLSLKELRSITAAGVGEEQDAAIGRDEAAVDARTTVPPSDDG